MSRTIRVHKTITKKLYIPLIQRENARRARQMLRHVSDERSLFPLPTYQGKRYE